MARMQITEDELNKEASSKLLPVEQDGVVNGLPTKVKIKYLAEITTAKEQVSKTSGGKMLVVTYSIWHPESHERLNLMEYYPYSENAVFKLKALVLTLGLNPKALDSDEFLGRWVIVTIKHEQTTGTTLNEATGQFLTFTNNRIYTVIRQATPEEVMLGKQDVADAPVSGGAVSQDMPDWTK